jgi:protein-S-isoprenylcysteine O-methyltransferase
MASALGMLFTLSEAGLAVFKRAKAADTRAADGGSLALLWIVIIASVFLAYGMAGAVPALQFGPAALFIDLGVVLFVSGLALRWYSILLLGRFFTVDVAIAADHRLIETGPYRFIRHPSYSGALLAFVGLGFCLHNWASLAVIVIPTLLAFSRRIRIEERALALGLGDEYRNYMHRTKRLIPAVY